MPSPDLFLLDTNVLVHLIRGGEMGRKIDARFSLRSGLRRRSDHLSPDVLRRVWIDLQTGTAHE